VDNLNIYEFNKENTQLRSFSRVNKAIWNDNKIIFLDRPEKTIWNENKVLTHITSETELAENYNPFKLSINKPGHLTISETNRKIKQTKSEVELTNYRISIQKKYTTLFFPFVIILFTAPFVLSLKQKGNVITLGYAIGAWLLFMGTVSAFEQFGQSNFLSPVLAVWFPLILFTIIGFYLISRIRT
ncbi:MAG: LptF/LptG family permease, partial [Aridibacter sp.]